MKNIPCDKSTVRHSITIEAGHNNVLYIKIHFGGKICKTVKKIDVNLTIKKNTTPSAKNIIYVLQKTTFPKIGNMHLINILQSEMLYRGRILD